MVYPYSRRQGYIHSSSWAWFGILAKNIQGLHKTLLGYDHFDPTPPSAPKKKSLWSTKKLITVLREHKHFPDFHLTFQIFFLFFQGFQFFLGTQQPWIDTELDADIKSAEFQ